MKLADKELLETLPEPVLAHIKHLERVRRDFVANVSHELRTPLTVIHGYLETLLEQEKNNETKQAIFQQMYHHSIRMARLIEELLLLSRLENDEQFTNPQTTVDVATLLKELTEDAKSVSGAQQHNIHCSVDEKLMLVGAEDELKSLFSNLIYNAVKYTPSGGDITINWYKQNGQAVFAVTDTGIGIAKKHIPRITERFYRVDKARSRESGGTGLGLAIVKHVLIRHDGELAITSEVNKGSTFTCFFPIERTSLID